MNASKPLWIPGAAMAVVVAASNFLVQFPINEWLTIAAFTYPMAFWVTDVTNRWAGPQKARAIAAIGLIVGVLISGFIAPVRIAIASGTAFLFAQLLDIFVFNKLRQKSWWQAPFIGSILASTLDTFLFFSLAFVGTGINWIALGLGDLVAKFFMAAVLLIPYRAILRVIYPREA